MIKIVVGSSRLTQPLLLYSGLGPAMLHNIGGVKVDGFSTIINRIQNSMTVEMGMFQNEESSSRRRLNVCCLHCCSLI
jgi:hypothetical protein